MDKNSNKNTSGVPKIALFYDWLNQWGGAEKVLLDLINIFPEAPIFTLVHNPQKTQWLPENKKIITSFINKLPFSKKNPIFYTPFYNFVLEKFDFSQFDIVISTTSTVGHCFLTQPKTLFICYFHNINRYVYQTPKEFKIISPFLNIYKKIDSIFKNRPDILFCNSQTVQNRIKNNYQLSTQIIYPGIDINQFHPSPKKTTKKYFLVVSRLVPHKKIDIVIKACNKLNLRLKIVGTGRSKNKLIDLKNSLKNHQKIKFLGQVSNQKLIKLYQNCQALICPQEEDFGLTQIEVQACGKPVIGFNKGGNTETIINNKTGILFNKQTVFSLIKALKKFKNKKFDQKDCVNNSQKFSNNLFMLNFKKIVDQLWINHQKHLVTIS